MTPAQSLLPRRGPRLTLVEWGALPEDEPGELVDGYLVEEEDVGALHDIVAGWFHLRLGAWIEEHGGFSGVSDTRFAVSAQHGRKPDLFAYFRGRLPPAEGLVDLAPDLVVEVVSPTPRDERRDRVEKLAEYAGFGVRWYWIVDPQLRSLEIFELGADGRYVHALGATSGRVDTVPGCPGLSLDLDALWTRVDALVAGAPR